MVQKNAVKIWDVDVGNIVTLKLIETIETIVSIRLDI